MAKRKMGANLHLRIPIRHKNLLQAAADAKRISLSNHCRKILADAAEGSGDG